MAPRRSFRMTFSQVSALVATLAVSRSSRLSSAVLSRSLWQVTQYCLTTAPYWTSGDEAGAAVWAAAPDRLAPAAATHEDATIANSSRFNQTSSSYGCHELHQSRHRFSYSRAGVSKGKGR